jgi:hypothetical protein
MRQALFTSFGTLAVAVGLAGASSLGDAWPAPETAGLRGSLNSAKDFFGNSVAIDGDTAVVGATHDETVLGIGQNHHGSV